MSGLLNSKKAVLVTILALCLVGVLGIAAADEPVELEFWSPFHYTGKGQDTLDLLTDKFNKTHPGIKVVHQGQPNLGEKYKVSFAGGVPPDIGWQVPQDLLHEDAVVPMDVLAERYNLDTDQFWPRLWGDIASYKGHQWGYPFEVGSSAMIYNREWFEKSGIVDAPATWNEFLKVAKKLTDPEKEQYALQTGWQSWVMIQWVWRNKGRVVSEDGKTVTLTNEQVVEATQWLAELGSIHNVVGGSVPAGTAAMIVVHPGWYGDALNFDFEIGTAPPPVPADGEQASLSYYKDLCIFRSSPEREEAAWEFIQWLMAPEQLAIWCAETGYLPVSRDVLGTDRYSAFLSKNPGVMPWIDQLNYLRDPGPQRSTGWWDVVSYFHQALTQVRKGETSAYVALSELQEAAQAKLDEKRAEVFGE